MFDINCDHLGSDHIEMSSENHCENFHGERKATWNNNQSGSCTGLPAVAGATNASGPSGFGRVFLERDRGCQQSQEEMGGIANGAKVKDAIHHRRYSYR